MRFLPCIVLLAALIAPSAIGQPVQRPRVFLMDADALVRVRSNPEHYRTAIEALRKDAERRLSNGPYAVTDKDSIPPSGDKHDYMSMGPYWWPDPNKPDGLPYIRRDGETNPEIRKIPDHANQGRLYDDVRVLATAYYLTGDRRFAEHAAKLLRTWYLDPATRMNPNLNFGQGIPGRVQGRGIGIIETRGIGMVTDAIGLLESALTAEEKQGLRSWMDAYLTWLLESPHGKDEADEHNNHGTWYDVQAAAMALYLGKTDLARTLLQNSIRRLPSHIEPDGRQPHELARTKSWGYSVMNLQAFLHLAALGEHVGIDLWTYRTRDGRSIRGALDYLLPYAADGKTWTHKQIAHLDPAALKPLLLQASRRYGLRYLDSARRIPGEFDAWQALVWRPEAL